MIADDDEKRHAQPVPSRKETSNSRLGKETFDVLHVQNNTNGTNALPTFAALEQNKLFIRFCRFVATDEDDRVGADR